MDLYQGIGRDVSIRVVATSVIISKKAQNYLGGYAYLIGRTRLIRIITIPSSATNRMT